MKAILDLQPLNVVVASAYTVVILLSFVVLKCSFRSKRKQEDQKYQISDQNSSAYQVDNKAYQFLKCFSKSFFHKYTIFGSFLAQNKLYLIKQILILACIGFCAIGINSIILWPWIVCLCMILSLMILFEVIFPFVLGQNQPYHKFHTQSKQFKEQNSQNKNLSIQQTQLKLSVKCKKSQQSDIQLQNKYKNSENKVKLQTKYLKVISLGMGCFLGQILMVNCVLTLGKSVSNSGLLNIISVAIVFSIDQFFLRPLLGLFIYLGSCLWLKYTSRKFQQNFFLFCLCRQTIKKKNPEILCNDYKLKLSFQIKPSQQISYLDVEQSKKGSITALVFNDTKEQKVYISTVKQNQAEKIVRINRNKKSNYSEQLIQFTTYQIQMFNQNYDGLQTNQQKVQRRKMKIKSIFKKKPFSSDPLIYFPYEQCKANNKRPNDNQLEKIQLFNDFDSYDQQKKQSFQNQQFPRISIIQCIQQLDISQPQVLQNNQNTHNIRRNLPLEQKDLNIQNKNHINIDEPKLLTLRPKQQQNTYKSQTKLIKKKLKKSPYLVHLGKQVVKPGTKTVKNELTNKQNLDQTNSFCKNQQIDQSRSIIDDCEFRKINRKGNKN